MAGLPVLAELAVLAVQAQQPSAPAPPANGHSKTIKHGTGILLATSHWANPVFLGGKQLALKFSLIIKKEHE